jgi:4-alpha-glucanotransferase
LIAGSWWGMATVSFLEGLWKEMHARRSGILMHPTSLPGPFGIGDLGPWAYRFAEFLAAGGQTLWQVLPLGPPGYGNSPYQCYSALAGNPLLISLELLERQGLLTRAELAAAPPFESQRVDFGAVQAYKWHCLNRAAERFFESAGGPGQADFENFCARNASWLNPFAEFAARKDVNGGELWTRWRRRSPEEAFRIRVHMFVQFEFFEQWLALKSFCHARRIRLIGDLPIFVAHDSADVWANPQFFDLDEKGDPRNVAGVPPDYFSATGQLWGNPLYRWDALAADGYSWWVERVRSMLELVDIIRIDHFRGFAKYYAIPAGAATAMHGRWLDGPGDELFRVLEERLGGLPFIAEDLGLITPDVEALRDRWRFPGMRILQFAFSNESPEDAFKPYNFIRNCVVYTGTHDNDTTVGWFTAGGAGYSTRTADQVREEREFALRYLSSDGREIHWDFIRAAIASTAGTAIFPMQDVLGLGAEARMNRPASSEGNWEWRMLERDLDPALAARLHSLCRTYGRLVE